MTITKLIYENEAGGKLEFSSASDYHTNIQKDVSGLSDVETDIYSISSMGQDGDTYLGNRIVARDIQIEGHIRRRTEDAAHDLKRAMNSILNPKYKATLTFERGEYRLVIDCNIASAPIFKASEIFDRFIIRLSCLNPFWRELAETRDDIAAWIGSFIFPVNLSSTWEIGYRQPSLIVNVENSGDISTGLRVEFKARGTLTNPKLLNILTNEYIKVNKEMAAGDVITVTTGYGEKSVNFTSAGTTSNAFQNLDANSVYLQLGVGTNLFQYSADEGGENLEVSVYHANRYLGV